MAELRIKLMSQEATRLMEDAEYLRGRIASESNGAYLLDVLALEILLKCCVVLNLGKLERGHDYVHIFLKLPKATRDSIVHSAAVRMGPTADYSDVCWLLNLFASNFIRLRYPYEAYAGMSEEQYLRAGEKWVERGALVEEATFDFCPSELHGMLYALSTHVDAQLAG